jgi:hypothetical protein
MVVVINVFAQHFDYETWEYIPFGLLINYDNCLTHHVPTWLSRIKHSVKKLNLRRCAGVSQSVYWLGYGLDDRGWSPGRDNEVFFSLRHRVETGSGSHPAWHSIGTFWFFPGSKSAGAWIWLLTSSLWGWECVELYIHSLYVLMSWYLINHKEDFTFIFTQCLI